MDRDFLDSLFADIDPLLLYAGIHNVVFRILGDTLLANL
jgi:hypothetical protein